MERLCFSDSLYIGADGCAGGWIAAILDHGALRLARFETIRELTRSYSSFDSFLIDMVIGLRNDLRQIRPADLARKELGPRLSTVLPGSLSVEAKVLKCNMGGLNCYEKRRTRKHLY